MTIRLEPGAAERIARLHDDASTVIQGSADSFPAAPDGGLGSDKLASIMAALSETADTLAGLDELAAAQLRDIGSNYARTEDEVAGMFSRLTKELE